MTLAERRAVGAWLLVLWALVLLMVMIGGTTRLTGSGLSIVEWRPVTGALPPLSEEAWQVEFEKYQATPQFQRQNHWMALPDFKRIYFWEYVHRLMGRLIGLAFAVPFAWFLWRRTLRGAWIGRTLGLFLLGGLQGLLGWFMVQSGLVNEPRVSHYRLAAHLLLGVGVGQCILWQALSAANPRADAAPALPATVRVLSCASLALLALQLFYGALMAGTHAGHVAATFPDMNGRYAPSAFFVSGSLARDLLDNPLSIHYLHRVLAAIVLLHAIAVTVAVRRSPRVLLAAWLYLGAVFAQGALGALTAVLQVPVPVAVAHQGGAYIVCSAAVLLAHAALAARTAATSGSSPAGAPLAGDVRLAQR